MSLKLIKNIYILFTIVQEYIYSFFEKLFKDEQFICEVAIWANLYAHFVNFNHIPFGFFDQCWFCYNHWKWMVLCRLESKDFLSVPNLRNLINFLKIQLD